VDGRASIIDIGGGASRLVDALIAGRFSSLTVLDLSEKALATARARFGAPAAQANWIVADIAAWRPSETYDVWYDRAAFHFLTEPDDRAAYALCVQKAVRPGGHVIIGTFALDGPERSSDLPVIRHDAASLGTMLGSSFRIVETRRHDHPTPGGRHPAVPV
jgi:2-polyprenyl-3-methyl-5-hydroxy-6-metoxy-1,4-benzoquinol methylase